MTFFDWLGRVSDAARSLREEDRHNQDTRELPSGSTDEPGAQGSQDTRGFDVIAAIPPSTLDEARRFYEKQTGRPPEKLIEVNVPCPVSAIAEADLGPMVEIEFRVHGESATRRMAFEPGTRLVFAVESKMMRLSRGGEMIDVSGVISDAVGYTRGGTDARVIDEAIRAYRRTHGGTAPHAIRREHRTCPTGPLMSLGEVVSVLYGPTDKGDGPFSYRHQFTGSQLPLLVLDVSTISLHFVLGSYSVSDHGLEDTTLESPYSIVATGSGERLGHYGRGSLARSNPGDIDYAKSVGAPVLGLVFGLVAAYGAGYALNRWGGRISEKWKAAGMLAGALAVGIGVSMVGAPAIGIGAGVGIGLIGGKHALSALNITQHAAGLPTPSLRGAGGLPTPNLNPGGEAFTPFPTEAYLNTEAA
jgi:hypothetical protein